MTLAREMCCAKITFFFKWESNRALSKGLDGDGPSDGELFNMTRRYAKAQRGEEKFSS